MKLLLRATIWRRVSSSSLSFTPKPKLLLSYLPLSTYLEMKKKMKEDEGPCSRQVNLDTGTANSEHYDGGGTHDG